ncbi:protein kinase [Coemansia erecta]|uniref:Protein kinase n=1 Tax=Coemansia erecta TaxID=147472 RepID=A0A9W7Y4W1_9FUNG|nr:protein kinase [Coemansia erecta]
MSLAHTAEFDVHEPGGSGSVTVDFSAFEHQKENIQPQPRGRSASALALLYGPATSDGDTNTALQPSRPLAASQTSAPGLRLSAHLQAENARYLAEMAATDPHESDDPLDVHFRYVQWLTEVFPQATGHQAVIRVVERPLREFRDHERYRNDARYLRMWLWYTGLINEGQEAVFQFLVANGIGDSLAALYEEYARVLEARGGMRKADEVFRLGVARKAQPLARLERRYDEFQRRVMAQTRRDVDSGLLGGAGSSGGGGQQHAMAGDENHAPGRTMLGNKRSGSSARSAAANTLRPAQRGLPSQAGAGANAPTSSRPNARISVFADPSGAASAAAAAAAVEATRPGDAAAWPDIGTDEARRKENLRAATGWRGQTLAQRPQHARAPPAAAAAERFTVFSDHADGEARAAQDSLQGSLQGSTQGAAPPGVLGQRGAEGARASAGAGSGASASALLHSFDTAPAAAQAAAARPREKPRERLVMPDAILFPAAADGRPQCVEEARARLPRYAFDYDAWVRQQQYQRQQPQQQQQRELQQKARPLASIRLDDDDDSRGSAGAGFRRAKRKSMAASSPTINTREAQQGMLGIWGASLGSSDSDSDSESLAGGPSAPHAGSPERPAAPDDYQFTMGPVTPHVVPAATPRLPLPLRASQSAAAAADENDAPTAVLDSIRSARRQQRRMGCGAAPTPLTARAQPPHVPRSLGPIDEASSGEDEDEDGGGADRRQPLGSAARLHVFRDGPGDAAPQTRLPSPLFGARSPASLSRRFDMAYDAHEAGPGGRTPGHTTRTGFSASGAEFSALSGFTGLSTIGGPSSVAGASAGHHASRPGAAGGSAASPGYGHAGAPLTPMRKRLSLAARDLRTITPRFPKQMGGGRASDVDDDDNDVDDDDSEDVESEDDVDDGSEPCTQNIGEFGDLDSQMGELQMQMRLQMQQRAQRSSMFNVFRDQDA